MYTYTVRFAVMYCFVYYKYKFNRPHDPCDMTNYTNKHYTMT